MDPENRRKKPQKQSNKAKGKKAPIIGRKAALLLELPKHGWNFTEAGIAAGYSPAYAARSLKAIMCADTDFCSAVAKKQAEMAAQGGDKVAKLVRSWEEIANDPTVSVRDRLKAGELLGKYHAIFTEKRIFEVPERQRQLDAAGEAEAKRIAQMRFSDLSLPPAMPDIVDAVVVRAEAGETVASEPDAGYNSEQQPPKIGD